MIEGKCALMGGYDDVGKGFVSALRDVVAHKSTELYDPRTSHLEETPG